MTPATPCPEQICGSMLNTAASTVMVILSTVTVSVKNITTPSDIQKKTSLEHGIQASTPVKAKRMATLKYWI